MRSVLLMYIILFCRHYDKHIVPKSTRIPHLIFFYTDWCFPCLQTAPYCRKLVEYLEPLGVNFVTVHSGRERNLGRRLNIHTLPCLILLIDENIYVYKETITHVPKIIGNKMFIALSFVLIIIFNIFRLSKGPFALQIGSHVKCK